MGGEEGKGGEQEGEGGGEETIKFLFVNYLEGWKGGRREGGQGPGGGKGRGGEVYLPSEVRYPSKRCITYHSLSNLRVARPGCNMVRWVRQGGGSHRPRPGTV